MTYQRQTSAYREMEVLSSSPERLIPLMYEHLLVNLKRGGLYIRKGDIEGKHRNLERAADIVCELISALDFEQGGEIATRLASLYAFWVKEISAAGRALDASRVDRVAEMVEDLHETWAEAVRSVESGQAPVAMGEAEGGGP